jgi:hypothetical protein
MSDYPDSMTLRPIEQWPGKPTATRQRSNFSAPSRSTLDLLDRELHYLGTSNRNAPTVLQVALREQDFRNDGMPRANARPTHPGVILSIESKHGPLSYPCDRFDLWQDNLRAIALSLEALRKVDRYGVTKSAEQYTGFKSLPAGAARGDATTADCEMVILSYADLPMGEPVSLDRAYRQARSKVHPDRRGGSRTAWDAVEAAADALRAAGRLT